MIEMIDLYSLAVARSVRGAELDVERGRTAPIAASSRSASRRGVPPSIADAIASRRQQNAASYLVTNIEITALRADPADARSRFLRVGWGEIAHSQFVDTLTRQDAGWLISRRTVFVH